MISLSSAFNIIGDNRAAPALEICFEGSLTLQTGKFRNWIYFSNDIMKKKMRHKGKTAPKIKSENTGKEGWFLHPKL